MRIDEFSEIRRILLRHAEMEPKAYNIRSNLNWGRYKKQVKLLAKILPRDQRVLDLGCGWGQTTAMLVTQRPDLETLGIDLGDNTPTWRELEKYSCRFRVGDATNLKIKDKEFDSVVSFGLMEHIDDRKFLREVHRVLKPRGYNILFNLPNRYSFSEIFAGAIGIWHHEQRYTIGQVVGLFHDSGFEILRIGRENSVPAQVDRVSEPLGVVFNRHYSVIDRLDTLLNATPLNFFSQALLVVSKKVGR